MNHSLLPLVCASLLSAAPAAAAAEELLIGLADLQWLVHERMFKGQDKIGSSFLGCSAEATRPRVALQNGRLLLTIFGRYDCLAMRNGLDISASAALFAREDRFGLTDFRLIESPDSLLNMLLGRVLAVRKEVSTRVQEALARKHRDPSYLQHRYRIQHIRVAQDGIWLRFTSVDDDGSDAAAAGRAG